MWSLWMVSFTKHIIFKVHLCLSLYQYVNCTIFYPFISLWTLGFLYFLAFVNNATLDICVQVSVWMYGFISPGCTSRIGIFGSYDNVHMGFPGGSDGKESACNTGELGSIHGKIPLGKGVAAHSSVLAWTIPWTEEPGGLQSMGSQRVGHSWATNTW